MEKKAIKEKIESLVKQYNEAYNAEKFSYEAVTKIDTDIKSLVGEYTALAQNECFVALKATEDPMLEAVRQLTFPSIRIKDTRVGEDVKIPVREVEDIDRKIDLAKLHKFCGGIGKESNWLNQIERFNQLMTAQIAVNLKQDPKEVYDTFYMSKISEGIDLGKNPTSKTNMLKTLTRIINAMIGDEYKAKSHDVNYLLMIYTKKGKKALAVTCANNRYMTAYIAEIAHRLVTGQKYDVEYKQK